jgi:hypothetical protein
VIPIKAGIDTTSEINVADAANPNHSGVVGSTVGILRKFGVRGFIAIPSTDRVSMGVSPSPMILDTMVGQGQPVAISMT